MAADIDIHDYLRDPSAFFEFEPTHNVAIVTSLMEMDEEERQQAIVHADWKANSHLIAMAIGLQRHDAVHFIVKHSSQRQLVLSSMVDVAAHHENTQGLIAPYFSELKEDDRQKYLRRGAQWGDLEAVAFALTQGVDPLHNNSGALRASLHYPDIVSLLAPVSNVNADNGIAIGLAAERGYLKSFQELLPFADQKYYIGALLSASSRGHNDIVDLLYPLCDRSEVADLVLFSPVPEHGQSDGLAYLRQLCQADHSKNELNKVVDDVQVGKRAAKKL